MQIELNYFLISYQFNIMDKKSKNTHEKKFRIGRHISISPSLLTVPSFASEIECDIIQIFLGNPQELYTKERDEKELRSFGTELDKYKQKVVIHGHYTINFCNKPSTQKFKAGVRCLVTDLAASATIGKRSMGVIIHMGKKVDPDMSKSQAMENYAKGLKECLEQTAKLSNAQIILETGAGCGSEIGTDLDDLKSIYDLLSMSERKRIGFCIDTCHIWAAGYKINTAEGVKDYFNKFGKLFGIENIACIHMNNSKNKVGSRVDRHADLGYGEINTKGLRAVAIFAHTHRIPLVMETPLDVVDPATNQDILFADEKALIEKWISKK